MTHEDLATVVGLLLDVYRIHEGGCCLHVLVEDGNYGYAFAQGCLERARDERHHPVCQKAAEALVRCSSTQQRKAVRLFHMRYRLHRKYVADKLPWEKLAKLMSDLSEEAYCAGWMMGLEYALWERVTEGPGEYGFLTIAQEILDVLKSLSDECGGWVRWDDKKGECFVPMDEWLALYERWKEKGR